MNSVLWTRTRLVSGPLEVLVEDLVGASGVAGRAVSKTIMFIGETKLNANNVAISPSHPRMAALR